MGKVVSVAVFWWPDQRYILCLSPDIDQQDKQALTTCQSEKGCISVAVFLVARPEIYPMYMPRY